VPKRNLARAELPLSSPRRRPLRRPGSVPFRHRYLALIGLLPTVALAGSDYTGFWKENCGNPYGLQIRRQAGQYAVTFCGPGGCGNHADSLTPIEGDQLYEVISPDRIRIHYSEGYAPVYARCSRDILPLLQYSEADRVEGTRNLWISVVGHVAYLALAIWLYISLARRSATLPETRRRIIGTATAAILFSPGMYFMWPFWSPSFALLAFLFEIPVMPRLPVRMVAIQLAFTLVPMLIVWASLFAAFTLVALLRKRTAPGIDA
jgi:hypothetical protein